MSTTPKFTENSRRIFDLRYPRKNEDGKPAETPEATIRRVADNVASVEAIYAGNPEALHPDDMASFDEVTGHYPVHTAVRLAESLDYNDDHIRSLVLTGWDKAREVAEQYYEMIARWDFLPNSPTWTGAGTPLGQLAACFVLPIDDDLATGRGSIFETLKVAALIQQTGGGNGFSFGDLRPSNAIVNRSMGRASGPLGFLRAYDAAFGEIAQGGSRRGANMGVLPVSHPDVEAFIDSKTVEGEIANFNISVAITDEFMEAVEKDTDFDLRWAPAGPTDDVVTYQIVRTVRARDLWEKITKNAWVIGDPGNLFIDRANEYNPVPTRYTLKATNPCGEQWLGPYENCCLGSINLANFAYWDEDFDWGRFAKTVRLATRFLDDVVDANQYVPAVPELAEAAAGGRRIGLGLMGLADAMLKMGVRYGSEKGLAFASQVTEFARFHTMLASIDLAKERGTFGWFEDSIYDLSKGKSVQGLDGKYHRRWTQPTPLTDEMDLHDFGRPDLDWVHVEEMILKYGIRNSCQFTFAPTGTISNVAALEGSGCEPLFALVYYRTVMQEGENVVLPYASPLFHEALKAYGISEHQIGVIVNEVRENGGSCQGLASVPKQIRDTFVVAGDITWEEHVRTQAVLQRFVDNSISKTINMPNSATVEDVAAAYRLAYDLGCKGITIYRQGSRDLEVLSTGKKEIKDDQPIQMTEDVWPVIRPMSIPTYASESGLTAKVFPVQTPFGKVQVTVTELDEHPGRPFDLRIQLGKAGNDKNADVEALGRSISLALRAGVDVQEVVDQLDGIGGATVHGFGPARVRSVADGIAKLLKRRYIATDVVESLTVTESITIKPHSSTLPGADPERTCPRCNLASVVVESGCAHCDPRLGGCGEWENCE